MKHHHGETMIEAIIFIMMISLLFSSSQSLMNTILINMGSPAKNLMAGQLANARMNLMSLYWRFNPDLGLIDPCAPATANSFDACVELNDFASSHQYAFSTIISSPTADYKQASITVSGPGSAVMNKIFYQ